jgi:hypothetical protein
VIATAVILHIARNGDVSLTGDGILAYFVVLLMIFLNTIASVQGRR